MYNEKVIDYFTNPRNSGAIENANGVGQVGNPKCGDILKMYLKIEQDVIVDVRFKTFGCAAAVASGSMATEMVKGKNIYEALALSNQAIAKALGGLPPHKMHCSLLAEEAVREAIHDYLKKNGREVQTAAVCPGCCNNCGKAPGIEKKGE